MRVGDIAEEAGVAHGLVYHYFASKDEVLETIFRETWTRAARRVARIEASDEPPREQLGAVATIAAPHVARRSPTSCACSCARSRAARGWSARWTRSGRLRGAIERIVERGQADGELRHDLDARLASWIFYGALEEILTGWVLGELPDGDEEVARAERTVVELVLRRPRAGRRRSPA